MPGDDGGDAFEEMGSGAQLGHGQRGVQQGMGSNLAQQDQNARLDLCDLLTEEGQAGGTLMVTGGAVMGRAAFHHIGNGDLRAPFQSQGREHAVQQASGRSDEGQPARIFFCARSFSDEHPGAAGVNQSKNRLLALFV